MSQKLCVHDHKHASVISWDVQNTHSLTPMDGNHNAGAKACCSVSDSESTHCGMHVTKGDDERLHVTKDDGHAMLFQNCFSPASWSLSCQHYGKMSRLRQHVMGSAVHHTIQMYTVGRGSRNHTCLLTGLMTTSYVQAWGSACCLRPKACKACTMPFLMKASVTPLLSW